MKILVDWDILAEKLDKYASIGLLKGETTRDLNLLLPDEDEVTLPVQLYEETEDSVILTRREQDQAVCPSCGELLHWVPKSDTGSLEGTCTNPRCPTLSRVYTARPIAFRVEHHDPVRPGQKSFIVQSAI